MVGVPKISSQHFPTFSKGWSGNELCERLINQLAGDYLRENDTGYGVFLLVWQGNNSNSKTWKLPKPDSKAPKSVPLHQHAGELKNHWQTIETSNPNVEDLGVIVIDLTLREHKSSD